ncbi:hypothetical protein SNEBB_002237 [Seison nebaliae]|nr:hypothetical protein SNEBB_002237 [Seison nebaliae]
MIRMSQFRQLIYYNRKYLEHGASLSFAKFTTSFNRLELSMKKITIFSSFLLCQIFGSYLLTRELVLCIYCVKIPQLYSKILSHKKMFRSVNSRLSLIKAFINTRHSSGTNLSEFSNAYEYNQAKGVNENKDLIRSRLIYQSRKRGNLENGILLSNFVKNNINQMKLDELKELDIILNATDNEWDLYFYAIKNKPTPNYLLNLKVFQQFQKYVENEKKEQRLNQPPL